MALLDVADDHYVSSAPPWQLRRLKKEDLLRIYGLAGLSSVGDVGEDLTKTDLITAILRAVRALLRNPIHSRSSRHTINSERTRRVRPHLLGQGLLAPIHHLHPPPTPMVTTAERRIQMSLTMMTMGRGPESSVEVLLPTPTSARGFPPPS